MGFVCGRLTTCVHLGIPSASALGTQRRQIGLTGLSGKLPLERDTSAARLGDGQLEAILSLLSVPRPTIQGRCSDRSYCSASSLPCFLAQTPKPGRWWKERDTVTSMIASVSATIKPFGGLVERAYGLAT